ncbi:MAG: zinc-ribbon domain-containing protein [Gemmatimonadota bacterium]|nr:zinc-ribbon domain-containing protein [Gemmatimonadota bacterium]
MTPMFVQCSSCLTEFELDPKKVPAAGVRARCSVCSAVINVLAPRGADEAVGTESAPSAPGGGRESRWDKDDSASAAKVDHHASDGSPAATERLSASAPITAPAATSWREPTLPVAAQAPAAPPAESWSAPATSAAPAAPAAPATPATPAAPAAPALSAERAATPPAPSVEPDAGQRRPINPFLTRDPALRAKRLARALVSDIVAYHPARHAEGLRDGTLKTLFRDEIKKSYEEYVDQVGREFAGSTTHFQDALNDVLASGKKLF